MRLTQDIYGCSISINKKVGTYTGSFDWKGKGKRSHEKESFCYNTDALHGADHDACCGVGGRYCRNKISI